MRSLPAFITDDSTCTPSLPHDPHPLANRATLYPSMTWTRQTWAKMVQGNKNTGKGEEQWKLTSRGVTPFLWSINKTFPLLMFSRKWIVFHWRIALKREIFKKCKFLFDYSPMGIRFEKRKCKNENWKDEKKIVCISRSNEFNCKKVEFLLRFYNNLCIIN